MTTDQSLLVAPRLHRGESPNSWLIRVAHLHGHPIEVILDAVGLTNYQDADISMELSHFKKLMVGIAHDHGDAQLLIGFFTHLRIKGWPNALMRRKGGEPTTAYCPDCLSTGEAYYRAQWRMRFWVVCPIHKKRMRSTCESCESSIAVGPRRSIRRNNIPRGSDPVCTCCNCGHDLKVSAARDVLPATLARISDLQNSCISAITHGYFRLHGFDQPFPLVMLPAILAMGSDAEPRSQWRDDYVDPRLRDEIRSAKRHFRQHAVEGFYPKNKIRNQRGQRGAVWKGDAMRLAEIALKQRFLWPLAFDESDLPHLESVLREVNVATPDSVSPRMRALGNWRETVYPPIHKVQT